MTKAAAESPAEVVDQYYILATSPHGDEGKRVLKHADTFAVFDPHGDIVSSGLGEQGIYHEGTRHLSRLELLFGDIRPLLLSSTVKTRNDVLAIDLTNPDLTMNGELFARGSLHMFRAKLLWEGACYERIRIANYDLRRVRLALVVRLGADFADIFEVRGMQRPRRGNALEAEREPAALTLSYRGLDHVVRRTRIEFSPAPSGLGRDEARFLLDLAPQESFLLYVTTSCGSAPARARLTFDTALRRSEDAHAGARAAAAQIRTSNESFNEWLGRSQADLHMMTTALATGAYPYAGVPWFSTVFGRDGILTAWELLWVDPSPARGVLALLAETQADVEDSWKDAEPGKILHEMRLGEMAALGEIPFGRYYGSVDATPLFVALAGAYQERTADMDFIRSIWPSIERALAWIEHCGDAAGRSFLEYRRFEETGLFNQGWKDSGDSVSHADGTLADAPIALCEVQAYAYEAFRQAARLAGRLGLGERERRWSARAEELRVRFESAFWMEDAGTYALALDREQRPCAVVSSNAGQVLFGGIAAPDRAARTAERLLHDDSFSGFGIRTLAEGERRYNPMSYHNGSVWPHDNAVVAAGFSRYGLTLYAARVLRGLFEAATFLEAHRMPELFCGFPRRQGEGPTLYPVACAPQAWAAGAVFLLLQASLGLHIDAERRQVRFGHAVLPEFLDWIEVSGLRVGDATADLHIERHRHGVGTEVLARDGELEIVSTK